MSDSELSSVLSSPPASDDEAQVIGPLDKFLKKPSASKKKKAAHPPASPPVQRKRPASPPHEEVLADNPDIAVSQRRDMTRIDATNASPFALYPMLMRMLHHSSLLCSGRASPRSFRPNAHSLVLKISRGESSIQCRRLRSRASCVRSLASLSTARSPSSTFPASNKPRLLRVYFCGGSKPGYTMISPAEADILQEGTLWTRS